MRAPLDDMRLAPGLAGALPNVSVGAASSTSPVIEKYWYGELLLYFALMPMNSQSPPPLWEADELMEPLSYLIAAEIEPGWAKPRARIGDAVRE